MKISIAKLLNIIDISNSGFKHPLEDFFKKRQNNNLHFLIFIILSARTKDETTVVVCQRLFSKINTIDDILKTSQKEIQKLVYPVGFYKTKAKHLKLLAIILKNKFNSKIPDNIENLLTLPGVGRKTANLFVDLAFSKPGICVDTHVHRILNRIGYLNTNTTFETEMYLRNNLDKKYWGKINSSLVVYGQNICKPINPKCLICKINRYCSYYSTR